MEGMEPSNPQVVIPDDEKQAVYEQTDKVMSALQNASDVLPVRREDIDLYPKDYCMLLHNVLSKSECEYYMKTAEELGLQEIDYSYRKDYRNNERVVAMSKEVSDLIWNRISEFLKPIEITEQQNHRVGQGYALEGAWKPLGLNECWRLCRYQPGGHFAPHYDGVFIRDSQTRSMKTFMIYLNGGFEGGSTNFVAEGQGLYKENPDSIFKAEERNILLRIKPEMGMAIVFNHELLHEGEQLKGGLKYIMRSDILFTREKRTISDPKEERALQLLQQAERLESEKRGMEAAECYRIAFKLWPPLADAYKS